MATQRDFAPCTCQILVYPTEPIADAVPVLEKTVSLKGITETMKFLLSAERKNYIEIGIISVSVTCICT